MPFPEHDRNSPDSEDAESFSEELSPSDGYFQREIPSGTMVPDPSQTGDSKAVEDKVLIGVSRHEPQAGSSSSSRATDSPTLAQLLVPQSNVSSTPDTHASSPLGPSSPRSPPPTRGVDHLLQEDPFYMNTAPPPAYSASPSLATSPQSLQGRHYNTFRSNHFDQHLEHGLPNRRPESMGHPSEDFNEGTPLAGVQIRRVSQRRTILKRLLLAALMLSILSVSLTTLLNLKQIHSINNPGRDTLPFPKLPTGPHCSSATYKRDPFTYEVPVDGGLSVIQANYGNEGSKRGHQIVRTTGEIRVARLPKDSKYKGSKGFVTVDIHVSDPSIQVFGTWERNSRTVRVTTPRHARLNTPGLHCVSLDIVAWLPEDITLTSFLVSSTTLTLRVLDDVKIDVAGHSKLESISGDIYFPSEPNLAFMDDSLYSDIQETLNISTTPDFDEARDAPDVPDLPLSLPGFRFDSRQIDVETVSGNINGRYPLLDHLGFVSQSGDIVVTVVPHEALPSDPSPADLDIHTASGDIDVHLPIATSEEPDYTPPARDYITRVISMSGDITGTFYHGSSASFKTTSADIKVSVLPVAQSGSDDPSQNPRSILNTETTSGTTQVEIFEPIFVSLVAYDHFDQQDDQDDLQPVDDDGPYLLVPPTKEFPLNTRMSVVDERKLRSLQSAHTSKSGDISVNYPDAWEGAVSGKVTSGDIIFQGKDLKVTGEKRGYVYKEIFARKGPSKDVASGAKLSAISGDLWFIVGKAK